MSNILEITELTKKYGSRVALDGLNIAVPKGSVYGLVGPNGAGKTTTFSIIAGLLKRNGGEINIFNEGEFSPIKFKGRISLLAQDALFPPYSKVGEILMFFARLQGLDSQSAKKEVQSVLEKVDLTDRGTANVKSLSHGMVRRISVAQAFIGNPELIMLDEPTAGLDPKQVVKVRDLILNKKSDQTVIISSHILSEIEGVCDHVAFIEDGKCVYQESIEKTLRKDNLIRYILGKNRLTEVDLNKIIPKARFKLSDEMTKLTVSFRDESLSIANVNRRLLGFFLDQNIDIIELHTGTELEDEYLNFKN